MKKPSYSHRPRKRFGQNFLVDEAVIARIVRAINPQPEQKIVEIGPGLGALTQALLTQAKHINVIEIDRDLIPRLIVNCGNQAGLIIHEADALKFDFNQLYDEQSPKLRIVGNLPYNISTPLLFHLLEFASIVDDMFFMLQQEVVLRMAASVGNKHYGRLSVMLQYHCVIEHIFNVANTAFSPRPQVESAIVKLTPYTKKPHIVKDYALFTIIVREAFNHRRKTLHNALKGVIDPDKLAAIPLDLNLRPEKLSVADFVLMTNHIHQA